jgi:hypothetical protein
MEGDCEEGRKEVVDRAIKQMKHNLHRYLPMRQPQAHEPRKSHANDDGLANSCTRTP